MYGYVLAFLLGVGIGGGLVAWYLATDAAKLIVAEVHEESLQAFLRAAGCEGKLTEEELQESRRLMAVASPGFVNEEGR